MQGKKFIVNLLSVLVLLGVTFMAHAQGELYIFGVVKDYANGRKLEGVKITAFQNGAAVDNYTTSSNGKYEFFLDLGKEYTVEFERAGWVSKKVYMDSRNIPEEDVGAGFSMNIEMSLFEEIEGLDIAILEQPIGKAKYNPNTGALEFDFAYTQKIKDELNRLMRDWEKGSKEKRDAEEQQQKELEALEKEFNKLVADADAQFLKEEYQEAVANYKEALKLKPDNPMVQMKLKSAEEKLVEKNADRVKEEQYEAALKAGDDFMRGEEFTKAIAKYEEALGIKPDEKYPKDQIAEANSQLEAKKNREAELKQFTELVQKGDNFVKAMDFDSGIAKYREALEIKDDDGVIEKIKAAEKAKSEYEERQARQKEYETLVAQADSHFSGESYTDAISKYQEALGIIPEETYPKERIAEAEKRIAEIEKQRAEERKHQEMTAQFNELVAKGDARVSEEKFDEGIASYQEALGIFPDDKGVQKKLQDAEALKKAKTEEQALEARYNEAIQKGDEAFGKEDLEAALGYFESALGLKGGEAYPAQKIKEIKDLIAERERQGEEKRLEEERRQAEEQRLKEELEQFNNLVSSGDEFFGKQQFQQAIEQYEAALDIKPDNQHLPNKIKEAQKLLEDQRAKQDLDANYQAAIEEGDRKFKGQNFEGAIEAFERALALKSNEQYPKDQIKAAQDAIVARDKAAEEAALAEKQKAEEELQKKKEAEMAQLRDEFNRIVKLGDEQIAEREYKNAKIRYNEALELIPEDEEVRAKLIEADRLLNEMMQTREVDKQYNMVIADADASYEVKDYDNALVKYREASEIKPSESYPRDRMDEIEELLAEMRRQEESNREAELAAQRKKEQEEMERQRLDEEAARMAAIDDEYDTYIQVADRKMEAEEFDVALRNYKEALALKPGEYYPKAKIQEIELLLEEEAERRAEAERLAALERERQQSNSRRPRSGASVDSQTEDEAERFMREARLREEAEKYERIKRLKEQHAGQIEENRESETERSENYLQQVETFKQNTSELYAEASSSNEEMSERMQNYKSAIANTHADEMEKERKKIGRAQNAVKEQEEGIKEIQEKGLELHEKAATEIDQEFIDQYEYQKERLERENKQSQKAYKEVKEIESDIVSRDQKYSERQESISGLVAQRKESHSDYVVELREKEAERVERAKEEVAEQRQQKIEESAVMTKIVEENTETIEEEKQRNAQRQKQYAQLAEMRAKKAREDAYGVQANEPKDYDDYYLSQLAQEYPQGVTEESDNVGNKVIIRRIVVMGNKADEYRKVIDKTGKYYFKNGNSISERTWNSETNPEYD